MNTPPKSLQHLTRRPWIRALLAAVLVGLVGAALIRASHRDDGVATVDPHAGLAGPDEAAAVAFSLPDRDGTMHHLADFEGRPILLNFWASWCPPCLDEMPSLQRLTQALSDTDMAVIAVTLDTSWEDVDRVLEQTGFGQGALLLMDADRAVAGSYGTFKVPETYLIDARGRIVHHVKGARIWDDEQTIADLRAFAAGSMPSATAP